MLHIHLELHGVLEYGSKRETMEASGVDVVSSWVYMLLVTVRQRLVRIV